MKATTIITTLTLVLFFGFNLIAVPLPERALLKLTKERVPMNPALLTLCRPIQSVIGPHDSPEVDLFASKNALDYRAKNPNKFDYPIGSTFVKRKYSIKGAKEPDFETLMTRRSELTGTVADWEFSTRDIPGGEAVVIEKGGACADCHSQFNARGFVSWETEEALKRLLLRK